jgi:hypothetical protein
MDSDLVLQNDYLQYILENFEGINTVLFDLLQLFSIKKKSHHHHGGMASIAHAFHSHGPDYNLISPLHIALKK